MRSRKSAANGVFGGVTFFLTFGFEDIAGSTVRDTKPTAMAASCKRDDRACRCRQKRAA
jgi:hypothetical protein